MLSDLPPPVRTRGSSAYRVDRQGLVELFQRFLHLSNDRYTAPMLLRTVASPSRSPIARLIGRPSLYLSNAFCISPNE